LDITDVVKPKIILARARPPLVLSLSKDELSCS
jgi:hypothetical protein